MAAELENTIDALERLCIAEGSKDSADALRANFESTLGEYDIATPVEVAWLGSLANRVLAGTDSGWIDAGLDRAETCRVLSFMGELEEWIPAVWDLQDVFYRIFFPCLGMLAFVEFSDRLRYRVAPSADGETVSGLT